MNAAEQATDLLAAQECESLASCVSRGQAPESYQDIIAKIRGHLEKLPAERKAYWTAWCQEAGVALYPSAKRGVGETGPELIAPKKGKSTKPEASSTP
jgi:hypothetical protein